MPEYLSYTALVPTKDRPELCKRALASILAQTVRPLEIIVIDDASSIPFAVDFETGIPIRVIRHESSKGGAAARNAGLSQAQGDVVAFLDDDDEWHPAKMARQLAYFQASPETRLVTCGHVRLEGGARYDVVFTEPFVRKYIQYDNFVGSFSFIAVRQAGVQKTLLAPDLPAHQDWEFTLRVARPGEIGVVEEVLVTYHAHDLPRITTGRRNQVAGLRRCYVRHRREFTPDARRWLLSRIIFERSRHTEKRALRSARVLRSVTLGLKCQLPAKIKFRALARRLASLPLSPGQIAAVRCFLLANVQRFPARRPKAATRPA